MRIGPSNLPPAPSVRDTAAKTAVELPATGRQPGRSEPSLLDRIGGFFKQAARVPGQVFQFVDQYFHPSGSWHNPEAKAPSDTGGLKVASYNIYVKGKNLAQIERDLRKHDPDVVCLQETSIESAQALAKKLGMHVAWHVVPHHHYGGNAILSKHPIVESEEIPFDNPMGDRLRAAWHKLKQGDPRTSGFDARSMLRATIQVGDRKVDVLDMHLMLFGSLANTQNVRQLASYVKEREALGHSVIAGGDMNTNFAIGGGDGVADAKGRFDTPTDTLAEYRDRMGTNDTNIRNPENREAVGALLSGLNEFWDAPSRSVLVDGQLLTPEQAQAELSSGKVTPGSDRHEALLRAADGSTVLGAVKRFDNILASKDMRIESAHIDQTTHGSDHQPVFADIRWD